MSLLMAGPGRAPPVPRVRWLPEQGGVQGGADGLPLLLSCP